MLLKNRNLNKMWKVVLVLSMALFSSLANPIGNKESAVNIEDNMLEKSPSELAISKLNLPSNASSIRADITDSGFSCANKSYGYYADIENDCQIFHVCLPVTYADGRSSLFRWSFICPEETVFSQDSFTCMRAEDMVITCEESSKYFDLNGNFGIPVEEMSLIENEEKNEKTKKTTVSSLSNTQSPIKSQILRRKTDINKPFISEKIKGDDSPYVNEKKDLSQNNDKVELSILADQKNSEEQSSRDKINEYKDKSEKIDILEDSSTEEADIISDLINSLTNESNNDSSINNLSENEQTEQKKEQETTHISGSKNNNNLDDDSKKSNTSNSIQPLSIDDVVGLVKGSLNNKPEVLTSIESESIKPIYQRNEESTNGDSKIIVISKPNEEVAPISTEFKDSTIIPVEIIEPNTEDENELKAKSKRHLRRN